jgi:hypothetical protein
VHLGNNSLSGTLPATLGGCSKLQGLHMSFNRVRGPVPPNLFSQLVSLFTFDAANNLLTGTIPELGPCTKLQTLELWNNSLHGAHRLSLDRYASVCGRPSLYTVGYTSVIKLETTVL